MGASYPRNISEKETYYYQFPPFCILCRKDKYKDQWFIKKREKEGQILKNPKIWEARIANTEKYEPISLKTDTLFQVSPLSTCLQLYILQLQCVALMIKENGCKGLPANMRTPPSSAVTFLSCSSCWHLSLHVQEASGRRLVPTSVHSKHKLWTVEFWPTLN